MWPEVQNPHWLHVGCLLGRRHLHRCRLLIAAPNLPHQRVLNGHVRLVVCNFEAPLPPLGRVPSCSRLVSPLFECPSRPTAHRGSHEILLQLDECSRTFRSARKIKEACDFPNTQHPRLPATLTTSLKTNFITYITIKHSFRGFVVTEIALSKLIRG